MKLHQHIIACLLLIVFVGLQSTFAQARKDMEQDLKVLIKELPAEALLEVLEFAKLPVADEGNAARELKGAIKELPNETLIQLLAFAQAKKSELVFNAGGGNVPRWESNADIKRAYKNKSNTIEKAVPPAVADAYKGRKDDELDAQGARDLARTLPKTDITWYSEEHDFGTIPMGKTVTHTYKFKNTGDKPLRLTLVKPSCGCTSPKWSKEPIAPGEEGEITVEFTPKAEQKGLQKKSVTIFLNTAPEVKVLRFEGFVKSR